MVFHWIARAAGGFFWLLGRIVFGPPKKKPKSDDERRRHERDKRPSRIDDKENVAPHDEYSRQIEKQAAALKNDQAPNQNGPTETAECRRETLYAEMPSPELIVTELITDPEPSIPPNPIEEPISATDSSFQDATGEGGGGAPSSDSFPPPPSDVELDVIGAAENRSLADAARTYEVDTSADGSAHRTITREVTSEPNVRAEVTTETLTDRCGDTELFSQRRHEFEERRSSPSLGGGGGPAADSMFNVSKFSSSSRSETWSPADGFKNVSTSVNRTSKETAFSQSTSTVVKSSTEVSRQVTFQGASEAPVIPVAPPPPPTDKQRPMSMPSLDFNILEAIEQNKISLVGGQKKAQQQQQQKKPAGNTHGSAPAKTKDGHTINKTSDEESRRFQMLMKAFQPPSEDEGVITPRTRKKMFSSSSFYDEPKHIYPTVQEQVKLCKSIADSLSADMNSTSRGATMYIKRMKRSSNWITEGPDPTSSDSEFKDAESSEYEPTTPEVKSYDRPPLKLVLDPRQLQDAMKLSKTGIYNEHNVVSPDICFDLVRDLNSPTGKGAQLFAKRKKKSEKWIVDENSVKEAVKEAAAKHVAMSDIAPSSVPAPYPGSSSTIGISSSPLPAPPRYIPPTQLQELQERLNPRLKLIKSPWEAALESPHGSCDAAFELVKKTPKMSPLAAARMSAPSPQQPLPPLMDVMVNAPAAAPDMRLFSPRPFSPSPAAAPLPQNVESTRSVSPYYGFSNAYKPKGPKGWIAASGDQSTYPTSWGGQESPSLLDTSFSSDIGASTGAESSFQRLQLDQLPNYNNRARAWGSPSGQASSGFRPVRPSSAIYGN